MFLLVWIHAGFAGGFSDALERARASFLNGDYSSVETNLRQAEKSLNSINEIVKPEDLAFMVYISSLVAAKRGEDPLDMWRETFSIYGEYEGEVALFASKEQADLFMAIRMEMEYAESKTAYIPQKFGQAKIYIDGQEKEFEDTVLPGKHLLQIRCPKGEVVSKWHTLEKDPKWLSMCPYEIDIHASNNDDPFSLDALEESFDEGVTPQAAEVEEDASIKEEELVESKEEEKQQAPQSDSYFSGVKVQKMKAKPVFWGGVDVGVFVDTDDMTLYHGGGILLYQMGELELEFHAGAQISGGVNYIVTDGAMLGIHAGYHIPHDDVLFDVRFRKDVRLADDMYGYSRVRLGYQYSWGSIFGGVAVGLIFAIF